MDIAEFLLARIAEDEAAAREMIENEKWFADCGESHDARIVTESCSLDGRRVLAECEAKRRIVAALRDYNDGYVWATTEASRAEEALLALALPYAEHADYDQKCAWILL